MASVADPRVARLLGDMKAAIGRKDRAGINAAVDGLLDLPATLGPGWRQVAHLMKVSGELGRAHRAMEALVRDGGEAPLLRFERAMMLSENGRGAEARALVEALPAGAIDPAIRALVLGNLALTGGDLDRGRLLLTEAVTLRPGSGPAWLSLVTSGGVPARSDIAERLIAARPLADKEAPTDRARYHYALGKLLADRKDHAGAFAAVATASGIVRSVFPYSADADRKTAAAALDGWDRDTIALLAARQTRRSAKPIVVTGLPRSGTTLIEQILTSHSAVDDGGEVELMPHLAVAAGGASRGALEQHLAGGGSLEALADLYLHLLDQRFPVAGRVVDKTIDQSRFLGLIATILPDAPLIWMRRDPLDCAWSCFRAYFGASGLSWASALDSLAHHFRLEDALLAAWRERLGDRLLVVPFEALVDDPAGWTRTILAHCDLPEEPACFAPHETQRVVTTLSALQVRQPINRQGIGSGEPYRALMEPFLAAYRG